MVTIPTPTPNMLPNALPAVEMAKANVVQGTQFALDGLKTTMQLPTVTGAMQNAIQMGVTSVGLLGVMAVMHGGIMTMLGMPPKWMKNTILPS